MILNYVGTLSTASVYITKFIFFFQMFFIVSFRAFQPLFIKSSTTWLLDIGNICCTYYLSLFKHKPENKVKYDSTDHNASSNFTKRYWYCSMSETLFVADIKQNEGD